MRKSTKKKNGKSVDVVEKRQHNHQKCQQRSQSKIIQTSKTRSDDQSSHYNIHPMGIIIQWESR